MLGLLAVFACALTALGLMTQSPSCVPWPSSLPSASLTLGLMAVARAAGQGASTLKWVINSEVMVGQDKDR